jgi:cyclic pyranopterin phosphate synthase
LAVKHWRLEIRDRGLEVGPEVVMELTHLDEEGRVRMVDVGGKPDTERVAVARGEVTMRPETLRLIAEGGVPKGDVLAVAQVAGIMAAKRTPDLIPLCHPLLLTKVAVGFRVDEEASRIEITATVRCRGQTGVEMEALTAVSIAALTIYDMAKAVEKTMRIGNIRLVRKSGGKSGDWGLESEE